MIAKGTTHDNGVKLANYMTTGKEGERAELWQLCGFAAGNIRDAFRDVQVIAGGTRTKKPFFHVQVRNPDGEELTRAQWERVANRIETKLGLTGQPRAIAFHTYDKSGHEHMHVAWSRIDQDTLKAIPLPFFKLRLKEVCRELEIELGLTRVKNEAERPMTHAPTRAEEEQARRLGVDIREVRNTIRDCYDRSDCGRSFEAALADHGLILARGERRDYIAVDTQGGMYALGKRILGVTAAETRNRLSDLVREHLPTVDQVRSHIAERQHYEQREKPERMLDRDQEELKWHDILSKVAIQKEKAEKRFVHQKPQKERQRRSHLNPVDWQPIRIQNAQKRTRGLAVFHKDKAPPVIPASSTRTVGKVFDVFASAFESLFAPTPPARRQVETAHDDRKSEIDFSKHLDQQRHAIEEQGWHHRHPERGKDHRER